mgnify:CR=1 FL=1
MDIILEEDIAYKTKVNDFGVEPVNKRIITTGEKLIFFKKGIFEKEIVLNILNLKFRRNINGK